MKSLLKRKIILFLFLGILIGASFIGYGYAHLNKTSGASKTSKKETVHIVKREIIKQTLTISGVIQANEKATVRFQSTGKIAWIGVKKGDFVKKNQALASLDREELQKNLEKYLNTYMKTRWDYEQTKDEYRQPDQKYWGLTWDQRNDVDRIFQKAQFDLNNAVLDVELKDLAIRYATIYAPIDGLVTFVGSPYTGVFATPTQAEIEIINPNSLYFSLLPDQNEVTALSPGMSADLLFDAFPQEHVPGTISSISFTPQAGETNTVYETKIFFPIEDPSFTKYRVGMTGDAMFTTMEKRDVLAVPVSFINTEKDKQYVIKLTKGKKEKVYVETGAESDEFVEITGGLAEGDTIYD